jgi:hypothetical protein
MASPLPAGLTPVAAGRIGLWLLSVRSYKAARRRDEAREAWIGRCTLGARWAALVAPWTVWSYPGAQRLLSQLCGVSRSTAHGWLYDRRRRIPARHAERLACDLEARASRALALASELRAISVETSRRPQKTRR